MNRIYTRNIRFTARLQKGAQVRTAKPPEDSFFFRVFEKNLDVANAVIDTKYLQAMKHGVLNPQDYGCLTVLDSYYCYRAADTLLSLLSEIDDKEYPDLKRLVEVQYEGYEEYNSTFFRDWHIRTADSVNPTDTMMAYAEHEHHVMCAYPPIYTLVAMLPCYYLWPWFSQKIEESSDYEPGVYKDWFEGNYSGEDSYDSAYEIGNFIDAWQKDGKEFDESLAGEIFSKSMNYELAAFTEAYHEAIEGKGGKSCG
ncbi:MAG: hypothetical protein IJ711_13190 [Lachnospiraceae bacterium]|nr:hypothetical protein [Lachnospiraceae bacterium]